MRKARLVIAAVVALLLAVIVIPSQAAPPGGGKPAKLPEYSLGVGIYAGGETFIVQCDDRRTWDGVGEFGESDVLNEYEATEEGKGKFRIEPRAKNWGEQDLIAQIEVFTTALVGSEEGRQQQWQQQWHVGPYSNRAGLDSELAQIEQDYWVDLTQAGDETEMFPRPLGQSVDAVEYEIYAQFQLDSQSSEPVAKCEAEIVVTNGDPDAF